MQIKLKIRFEFDYTVNSSSVDTYGLHIFITEKDSRFEAIANNYIKYTNSLIDVCTSGLNVDGYVNRTSIYLPSNKHLGKKISHVFFCDSDRKKFLKKLFISLKRWCNHWEYFYNDSNIKIDINNNEWIFWCDHIIADLYYEC